MECNVIRYSILVCVWDWQNAPESALATVALKTGKVIVIFRNTGLMYFLC